MALAQPVRAQQVTATFTQSAGIFNYNFTVRNTTAVTLADVSISLPTLPLNTITASLGSPVGFQTSVDPGQQNSPTTRSGGFIDFLADSNPATPQDFFGNSTVTGFLIRSEAQLNGRTFTTLDVNGNSFSGTVVATAAAAAPEPGTVGLLAFGAGPAAGAFLAFRRRFVSSASLKG